MPTHHSPFPRHPLSLLASTPEQPRRKSPPPLRQDRGPRLPPLSEVEYRRLTVRIVPELCAFYPRCNRGMNCAFSHPGDANYEALVRQTSARRRSMSPSPRRRPDRQSLGGLRPDTSASQGRSPSALGRRSFSPQRGRADDAEAIQRRHMTFWKTEECREFARGTCPKPAAECSCAHGRDDLTRKLCREWLEGECLRGNGCPWRHGHEREADIVARLEPGMMSRRAGRGREPAKSRSTTRSRNASAASDPAVPVAMSAFGNSLGAVRRMPARRPPAATRSDLGSDSRASRKASPGPPAMAPPEAVEELQAKLLQALATGSRRGAVPKATTVVVDVDAFGSSSSDGGAAVAEAPETKAKAKGRRASQRDTIDATNDDEPVPKRRRGSRKKVGTVSSWVVSCIQFRVSPPSSFPRVNAGSGPSPLILLVLRLRL